MTITADSDAIRIQDWPYTADSRTRVSYDSTGRVQTTTWPGDLLFDTNLSMNNKRVTFSIMPLDDDSLIFGVGNLVVESDGTTTRNLTAGSYTVQWWNGHDNAATPGPLAFNNLVQHINDGSFHVGFNSAQRISNGESFETVTNGLMREVASYNYFSTRHLQYDFRITLTDRLLIEGRGNQFGNNFITMYDIPISNSDMSRNLIIGDHSNFWVFGNVFIEDVVNSDSETTTPSCDSDTTSEIPTTTVNIRSEYNAHTAAIGDKSVGDRFRVVWQFTDSDRVSDRFYYQPVSLPGLRIESFAFDEVARTVTMNCIATQDNLSINEVRMGFPVGDRTYDVTPTQLFTIVAF